MIKKFNNLIYVCRNSICTIFWDMLIHINRYMNNLIFMHSAILNPTLLFSHISCINETYTVNYLSEKLVNSEFKGSYTKFTTFKIRFVHTYVLMCSAIKQPFITRASL